MTPVFKSEFPGNLSITERNKLNSKRILDRLQSKGITGPCIVGQNGTCTTHGQSIKDCK
jgi:hypothetical protein